MKRIILIFIILIFQVMGEEKNILFLNSYSRDFAWTEEQLNGIQAEILDEENINFYFEYLDNKNVSSELYLNSFKTIFEEKYRNKNFDLIVVTDDFAFDFIRNNLDLLKRVPYVIASGINGQYPENNDMTIIYERYDIEKNIKLAKNQNRNLKNVYFVTDESKSSQGMKVEINDVIKNDKSLNYYWLPSDYFELKKEISKLKPNSVIFHLVYFRESSGISSKYDRAVRDLYGKTKTPVYMAFSFYLNENNNLLGGYLIDGNLMGKEVGIMIKKYFQGEILPRVIEDSSVYSTYQFNNKALRYFKIKNVPKESLIHYKDKSYFATRKIEISIMVVILIISGFSVRYYRRDYKRELKLNEQNKAIIELNENLMETQKEIIAVLGQIIENRSEETANHTKRVAKISKFIAKELGFEDETADIIEIASPLHDVGKIGIPESVLHKPGKLEIEEFEIIKTHANIGYEILKKSKIPILFAAANIAHEHHERWDGRGYPRGLKGGEINIYARITTAADIFDALLSRRVYKEPWSIEEVVKYYEEQRGKIFDPKIVDVFLENIDKIVEIREELRD